MISSVFSDRDTTLFSGYAFSDMIKILMIIKQVLIMFLNFLNPPFPPFSKGEYVYSFFKWESLVSPFNEGRGLISPFNKGGLRGILKRFFCIEAGKSK